MVSFHQSNPRCHSHVGNSQIQRQQESIAQNLRHKSDAAKAHYCSVNQLQNTKCIPNNNVAVIRRVGSELSSLPSHNLQVQFDRLVDSITSKSVRSLWLKDIHCKNIARFSSGILKEDCHCDICASDMQYDRYILTTRIDTNISCVFEATNTTAAAYKSTTCSSEASKHAIQSACCIENSNIDKCGAKVTRNVVEAENCEPSIIRIPTHVVDKNKFIFQADDDNDVLNLIENARLEEANLKTDDIQSSSLDLNFLAYDKNWEKNYEYNGLDSSTNIGNLETECTASEHELRNISKQIPCSLFHHAEASACVEGKNIFSSTSSLFDKETSDKLSIPIHLSHAISDRQSDITCDTPYANKYNLNALHTTESDTCNDVPQTLANRNIYSRRVLEMAYHSSEEDTAKKSSENASPNSSLSAPKSHVCVPSIDISEVMSGQVRLPGSKCQYDANLSQYVIKSTSSPYDEELVVPGRTDFSHLCVVSTVKTERDAKGKPVVVSVQPLSHATHGCNHSYMTQRRAKRHSSCHKTIKGSNKQVTCSNKSWF